MRIKEARKLMNELRIIKSEGQTIIKLDGLEVKGVKEYEIKDSVNGITELSIKLDVNLSKLFLD